MNKLKCFSVLFAFAASGAFAATYYVSPDGNDSYGGSLEKPLATIQKANEKVVSGDTVFIRGGKYSITKPYAADAGILIDRSGRENGRIYFLAYPGEKPVFDFSRMQISASSYTHGFVVSGSWLYFRGLEICNVPMNTNSNAGVLVKNAGNDVFEQINSHHNKGAGFFVNDTKGSGGHLFLNCDSHDNYDPNGRQGDGQNADGFGYHYQKSGKVSVFRGCRAWWNSDDGWDFINQEYPVIVENSWAMGNGLSAYGTARPKDGNGNGFKAGSSKTGVRHTIRNCVAWKNTASGFYANHSSGGNDWYNNTAYKNGTAFNMWASSWDASGNRTDGVVLTGSKAHVMKNNIAYPNKTAYIGGDYASGEYNTWNLNIAPTDADFLSVDDPSMTVTGKDLSTLGGAFGARRANGDLPDIPFLKLSPGSRMIDKGVDVGLAAEGKPDLGAYEYSADTAAVDTSETPTALRNPGKMQRGKTPALNPAASSRYLANGRHADGDEKAGQIKIYFK